jgi:hypothetical protein
MCLTAKIVTNILYAAKQGNAEEQPDASCGIKPWKAVAKAAAFLSTGYPQRINLRSLRTKSSSAVRL